MSSASELRALRDALRQLLGSDTARPSERGAAPLDRSRWLRLARDMGMTGVRVPESLGGAGMDLEDELLVHEELGRALSDLPYLSTTGFAAAALAAVDSEAARERLTAVADGSLVVATVLQDADPDRPIDARRDGDTAVLEGVADCVADAGDADAVLVAAEAAGVPLLVWVAAGDPGVEVERLPALDLSRRFARLRFASAPGTVLAEGPAAVAAIDAARANGYLALAAESVGVAARALELTVDYVKVRHQFGRPIGGFQAVKHRCADMVVELERARSAVDLAARALGRGEAGDAGRAALAVARIQCGDAAFWITNETIHLHGGIGFTWEHAAHLYYRRAKSNQLLLDPLGLQRRELGRTVAALYEHEEAV